MTRFVALFLCLRLIVQWGLEQRPQDRVGGGAERAQEARGGLQLRLRPLVEQSM
jgi:hypothetical protein